MTPREIQAALAPWKDAHRRPAWKPRVAAGGGAPTGSRFGGAAWLPDGRPPLCGQCGAAMPLLVQIDLGSAPGDLGKGLLQAFYCADPDCEQECDGWAPFSAAHLVRVVDAAGSGALAAPRKVDHPARSIVGWDAIDDLPSPEEHGDLGLDAAYDFTAKTLSLSCPSVGLATPPFPMDALPVEQIAEPAAGDKLLGWPRWVQGAEYPDCPKCQAKMRYLVQIDSEDNLPIMWGDVGIAHICQCAAHPEVLTMGWACG